jgi:hypothetical protein
MTKVREKSRPWRPDWSEEDRAEIERLKAELRRATPIVRRLRQELALSQAEAAAILGTTQSNAGRKPGRQAAGSRHPAQWKGNRAVLMRARRCRGPHAAATCIEGLNGHPREGSTWIKERGWAPRPRICPADIEASVPRRRPGSSCTG